MALIGRKEKQSGETRVFTADYTRWFSNRTDSPSAYSVVADSGITVVGTERDDKKVKVQLSDGVHGSRYKVTVKMYTDASLTVIKEADFYVTIKDY